jgi:hypothetical protein
MMVTIEYFCWLMTQFIALTDQQYSPKVMIVVIEEKKVAGSSILRLVQKVKRVD